MMPAIAINLNEDEYETIKKYVGKRGSVALQVRLIVEQWLKEQEVQSD